MTTIEVTEPGAQPARLPQCQRCSASTLLQPGRLCADCIAFVGLSADRTEYTAWRRRIEDEVARGPAGGRS